jgi:RNA polymerase sigma factor (sigma-70 family)
VLATQTDARLVDLARAGYEPAFETIVSRYRSALLRRAERFLPRERAEDAVQQSFVSAYEAMLRDDSVLNLRPWLYRIAHNTSLNALRDRALRHAQLDEGIDGVERPDQTLERSQGLRELLAALQALPERQREALVLRELEGRSYEEVASELGVSDGSVRQLLNRAQHPAGRRHRSHPGRPDPAPDVGGTRGAGGRAHRRARRGSGRRCRDGEARSDRAGDRRRGGRRGGGSRAQQRGAREGPGEGGGEPVAGSGRALRTGERGRGGGSERTESRRRARR